MFAIGISQNSKAFGVLHTHTRNLPRAFCHVSSCDLNIPSPLVQIPISPLTLKTNSGLAYEVAPSTMQ